MIIASVILTDQQNAVGKNHKVLEYIPAYVKYFEKLTKDAPVIMGRKTFESLGHILRIKRNIVITKNEKYHSSRAKTYNSLTEALEKYKNEKKIFVIGGVDIFKQALPLTSIIYKTALMATFRSEDYYPDIDVDDFDLETSECIKRNEDNRFDYCVEKWVRTSPKK